MIKMAITIAAALEILISSGSLASPMFLGEKNLKFAGIGTGPNGQTRLSADLKVQIISGGTYLNFTLKNSTIADSNNFSVTGIYFNVDLTSIDHLTLVAVPDGCPTTFGPGTFTIPGKGVYNWKLEYAPCYPIIKPPYYGAEPGVQHELYSFIHYKSSPVYDIDDFGPFALRFEANGQAVYLSKFASIPEPASLLVMGIGLLGLGSMRQRYRKMG